MDKWERCQANVLALLKISLEVGLGCIELSLVGLFWVGLYFGLGCPGLGCKLGWVVLEPSITYDK